VERVERDDHVEALVMRFPLLEGGCDDLDLAEGGELVLRELREVRAELDGDDREAAFRQGQRGLTRAATDLEQARPRLQASMLDEIVEDLGGRHGSRIFITLGHRVESRSQPVSLGVLCHAAVSYHLTDPIGSLPP
jgi:hypothetical protein